MSSIDQVKLFITTFSPILCLSDVAVGESQDNQFNEKIIGKIKMLNPKITGLRIIQQKTINQGLLTTDRNFVVIGPTSSGKTMVAELAALKENEENGKVLYLVPLQQLVAEKEHDLAYLEKNTRKGKSKKSNDGSAAPEETGKNITVMTFETFYRLAVRQSSYLNTFSLAIVDEFHILYDKMRGFNLEKALTLLKMNGIRIICLSATFEDKREVSKWLNAILVEVPESERPSKIHHQPMDVSHLKNNSTKIAAHVNRMLLTKDKQPWLVFCSTRDFTRSRAKALRAMVSAVTVRPEAIRQQFEAKLGRRLNATEEELAECIAHRVGFYHSGVDAGLKEFVFGFFNSGQIDCLFTTTSLAYGVNTPTKSVLLYDLTLSDGRQSKPVDVYLYLQMAGRAGRLKEKGDGYAFVLVRNKVNLAREFPKYQEGQIEVALSHINEDDYFRKCVIELVYGGHSTQQEIFDFFKDTYFNFQSEKRATLFGSYDLKKIIGEHVKYLEEKGFLKSMGATGFKLTELGQVVAEYLFNTFQDHKLESFYLLSTYLDKERSLKGTSKLVYKLILLFDGLAVSKVPRQYCQEIEDRFKSDVDEVGNQEYAAYSIMKGWLQNMELRDIEEKYKVNSAELQNKGEEIAKVLKVAMRIASKKGIEIDTRFQDFITQMRHGVSAEEVPFVRMSGIGREVCRNLQRFSKALKREHKLKAEECLPLFQEYCQKETPDKLVKLLKEEVPLIGDVRAKQVIDLATKKVEQKVGTAESEWF
jgi:helicase